MATPEQLAALRDELRNEIRAELRRETAATAAQIPDAIRRKPEIPQFDKEHIDVWIRRTEHAFTRAAITSPQEKFAFLETRFPCSFNPRINEFLWGEATQARYNDFLKYLREEYGPSKQQKASIIVDGFKRDGRKPSQYAAALDEKTKNITLDDVKKEMLLREIPVETRRMLQERIEGLSFQETAKVADAYFDSEGRARFQTTAVNHIREPEQEPEPTEYDDVNAINQRFKRKPNSGPTKPYTWQNQRQPTPKGWHAQTALKSSSTPRGWHAQTAFKSSSTPRGWHAQTANHTKPPPALINGDTCYYHDKYEDKAVKCEVGCKFFDANRFPGNGRAGGK